MLLCFIVVSFICVGHCLTIPSKFLNFQLPKSYGRTKTWARINEDSIQQHTYTPSNPLVGEIVEVRQLTHSDPQSEIFHVVINHQGRFEYVEGQNVGILPPGIDDTTGLPFKPRWYTMSSTRRGEYGDGKTLAVCVRQAAPRIGLNGQKYPPGICSTLLTRSSIGQKVLLTGPAGVKMILPERASMDDNFIFVSTGTGIAPFRALTKYLCDETVQHSSCLGSIFHLAGVRNHASRLYEAELDSYAEVALRHRNKSSPETKQSPVLNLQYVISRDEIAVNSPKKYVQDVLKSNMESILYLMNAKNAHIYFCGLKAMMEGIIDVFREATSLNEIDWDRQLEQWKYEGRWHVGVYSY